MFNKLFAKISEDIAIDLGTVNSLVYVRGRGIILNEPSVVALNEKTGQILAIGNEAQKMVGRTPAHIRAIRPLVRGVVSDFEVTEQMLKYFIEKAHKKRLIPFSLPRVIIGIPCGITEVERKAVSDAAKNAGAREVFLIEEPVAAAIGARLPIHQPRGNFIVDIGGGTAEVAVISLGGVVVSKSVRVAGTKIDEAIQAYLKKKHNLISFQEIEELLKKRSLVKNLLECIIPDFTSNFLVVDSSSSCACSAKVDKVNKEKRMYVFLKVILLGVIVWYKNRKSRTILENDFY